MRLRIFKPGLSIASIFRMLIVNSFAIQHSCLSVGSPALFGCGFKPSGNWMDLCHVAPLRERIFLHRNEMYLTYIL